MRQFHWSAVLVWRLAAIAILLPEASNILLPGSVTAEIAASQLFHEGQILDTKTGQPVSMDDLLTILAGQDVVYLGEEHQNRWHVDTAVKILDGLLAKNRQPVLALEMFSWDGQSGLDHYVSGGLSKADFLRESHWEQNWGGGFDNYEPLISFARDHRVPVLALNPPRSLVRMVAGKGMSEARAATEMEQWGMQKETFAEDAAYHDMIVKPLRQCHGGLSDGDYQRMYEASVFRDEGMAKVIAERLRLLAAESDSQPVGSDRKALPGPIVSYTGGGHIQYDLPVPHRVLRRVGAPVKQVSIYFTAFESDRTDDIREYLRGGIADYIWLTPLGTHGPPRRCK